MVKSFLSVFDFWLELFVSCPGNLCLLQGFKDSPSHLLGALWSWVMLSSVIHFGLIFVCRVWSETILPFVKKTCFPQCFGVWSEISPLGLFLLHLSCFVAGFAHLYASAILSWFLKLYSSWWFSTRDSFNVLGTCGYTGNNFDCPSGCEGWNGAPDI